MQLNGTEVRLALLSSLFEQAKRGWESSGTGASTKKTRERSAAQLLNANMPPRKPRRTDSNQALRYCWHSGVAANHACALSAVHTLAVEKSCANRTCW